MFALLSIVVLCISGVFATDEYVQEVQQECKAKSDLVSCGKYEALKYISKAASGEKTKLIDGVVEFVTVEKTEVPETANLFPAARQMPGDSEFRKFFKFLIRQADAFMGSRALAINLPDYAKIVDSNEPDNEIESGRKIEQRGKKKKAALLIPIVMLFKLFKIKILLAVTLAVVLFIKKALLLFALLAPNYLQMLKICKVPHVTASHGYHDEHDFGATGYGHHAGGYGGGYAKDWANSRAYAAQKPATVV